MNKLPDNPEENIEPTALRLRLGEILKERKITQTKFAELSGLSQNSVSTLVNQPAQIRLETIELICRTLSITPNDLFVIVKIGMPQ